MKKNRVMRFASVILILTLLSTSVISGTFAKYVTTNSGSDTARVAKFGVTIEVKDGEGNVAEASDLKLFATSYATEDTAYEGELSVKSSNQDRLVAPGTKGALSITITGTPEVATRLAVEFDSEDFTSDCAAIQLPAGSYTLAAGEFEPDAKTVTTTAVYEPVKFYFGTNPITASTSYTMTLEQLQTAMENIGADFDPNETLDTTYYIGWCWPYEGTFNVGTENVADFLDTYLGNEETLRQQILNFKISVTQID